MPSNPYAAAESVFVILHVERTSDPAAAPERTVRVLKALWSAAAADAEVERLNQASPERTGGYCWKVARLPQHPAPAAAASAAVIPS